MNSDTAIRARQGTYSIVAHDPLTGELGVAVQTHWFAVGSIVPWARPGVGAVATQANVEVSYGPRLLELLAEGLEAPAALARALAGDPGAHGRQVAVVDAAGNVAAYSGEECMPFAGHATGSGVSCQANIMENPTIWGAMLNAFEQGEGRLADRLLAALDAAEAAGGDIRGRQSAAILVVPASGEPWVSTVSLRVDDNPEPLVELRRLLVLNDAYVLAGRADAMVNEHDYEEAARLYQDAAEMAPSALELRFWAGLGKAHAGDLEGGVTEVRDVIDAAPGWGTLLGRLPDSVLPSISAVRASLGIESA
jgi:uncharacterized Ntn-hydrolase superfamily protein